MKNMWVILLLLALNACSNSVENEESISDKEIIQEMDDVDAMIKKDEERIDSMEKALKEQMEELAD